MTRRWKITLIPLLAFAMTAPALVLARSVDPGLAIPDLGRASLGSIGSTNEYLLGRSIVNEMYRAGLIITDPELDDYIQTVGNRLAATNNTDGEHYSFFLVDDPSVNAFALPGGFIGVHTGLMSRTVTESELAGVIAHEIAHIKQRHIARRYEAAKGASLKSLAALLGAIALAASGANPDSVGGALMLGQGMALQEQINFTRSQESEADRVGIQLLANASYDPDGMVSFFNTMQQIERIQNANALEFLQTHPLSTTRVIDAAQRAAALPSGQPKESRHYALMQARMEMLYLDGKPEHAYRYSTDDDVKQYRKALWQLQNQQPDAAAAALKKLRDRNIDNIHYHLAYAKSLVALGRQAEAMEVFEKAGRIFPDHMALGIAQADAWQTFGQPEVGLDLLRRLFNRKAPPAHALKLMTRLARESGNIGESYATMAEYYIRTGEYHQAKDQLQLALQENDITELERKQYQARLQELLDALSDEKKTARK